MNTSKKVTSELAYMYGPCDNYSAIEVNFDTMQLGLAVGISVLDENQGSSTTVELGDPLLWDEVRSFCMDTGSDFNFVVRCIDRAVTKHGKSLVFTLPE